MKIVLYLQAVYHCHHPSQLRVLAPSGLTCICASLPYFYGRSFPASLIVLLSNRFHRVRIKTGQGIYPGPTCLKPLHFLSFRVNMLHQLRGVGCCRVAFPKHICFLWLLIITLRSKQMLAHPASGPLLLDTQNLKTAALFFRAVNNPFRQRILHLLHKHSRLTVTEIYVKLRREQCVVSSHLGILREAKLVSTERMGKNIFYSVNHQRLEQLQHLATGLSNK